MVDGYVAAYTCRAGTILQIPLVSNGSLTMGVRIEELIGGSTGLAWGILLKFVDSGHVVGFDERTVPGRTCEFGAAMGDIDVGFAVRSCGKLLEQLEICKGGGIEG